MNQSSRFSSSIVGKKITINTFPGALRDFIYDHETGELTLRFNLKIPDEIDKRLKHFGDVLLSGESILNLRFAYPKHSPLVAGELINREISKPALRKALSSELNAFFQKVLKEDPGSIDPNQRISHEELLQIKNNLNKAMTEAQKIDFSFARTIYFDRGREKYGVRTMRDRIMTRIDALMGKDKSLVLLSEDQKLLFYELHQVVSCMLDDVEKKMQKTPGEEKAQALQRIKKALEDVPPLVEQHEAYCAFMMRVGRVWGVGASSHQGRH